MQLASSAIRLGGVAGKFVVIALLASQGTMDDVGRFTLLYTIVNISVLVIGGELHLGTLRLASEHRSFGDQCRIAANNLRFDIGVYALLLLAGTAGRTMIPAGMLQGLDPVWLALLIATDHAAQQVSRLHIFYGSPAIGNLVQGIKAGIWGWVFVPASMLGLSVTSQHITQTWLVCDLLALALAWHSILRLSTPSTLRMPFRNWLGKAARISRNYYTTCLANNLASNFDRFLVGSVMGITQLGRYGFWVSVASGIPLFLTSFVGARYFSALLTSIGQGRVDEFQRQYRRFLSDYVRLATACAAAFILVAPLIPVALHKTSAALPILTVFSICTSVVVSTFWQVPYQALYSIGDDRWLMWCQLSYLVAMLAGNILGAQALGILGLCLASTTTGLVLFLTLDGRLRRTVRVRRQMAPNTEFSEIASS